VVTEDTEAKKEQLNECRTNLDTIYATLGLTYPGCGSGAGWSGDRPLAAWAQGKSEYSQDVKDRADYVYDNSCPTADSGDDGTYQDNQNLSENTTEETGYQNGHYDGQLSTEDDSALVGNQVHCDPYNAIQQTHNATVNNDEDGTYNPSHQQPFNFEVETGDYSGHDNPQDVGANATVNPGENSGYNPVANGTYYPLYDSPF